jgi:hypothetical protein
VSDDAVKNADTKQRVELEEENRKLARELGKANTITTAKAA